MAFTSAVAVLIALAALLLYVYRQVVFGDWNYSFTNCLYGWAPFKSEGVRTSGYCYTDISDNVLPIAYATMHQGIFTDWVAAFSIGAPQGVNLYLSPLNYLYLLPLEVAMPLIAVIKVVMAFLGMCLLMRQFGYSVRGGIIAGATYALSAAMVTWQGWPHTEVGMYAPWLFLLIDMTIRRLRVRYLIGIAVLTFLMLTAGMPTFAAYFLYVAAAYALFYACRAYWKRWRRLLTTIVCGIGAVALGGIMSLPYTGSLLTSVGSNGYSESRSDWSSMGLGLPQIKTLFFPFLDTSTTLNNIESMLYTGILAVITVAFTLINLRRKPRVGFFAIMAIIVTLLLFTPVFDVVFTHMPMINTSYKFRIVILLNFALAIVLGINMDDLLTRAVDTARRRAQIWGASLLGLVGFLAMYAIVRGTPRSVNLGFQQIHIAFLAVAAFMLVVVLRTVPFATMPSFARYGGTVRKMLSALCSVIMCGAVIADTGYFASQYLPLVEKGVSAVPEATSTITYLQEHTRDDEKIVAKDVNFPVGSPMFYGLRDIRGHGLYMTNPDIKAYYNAIDESAYEISPTNTVFQNVSNENMLRYIGVKYVVSTAEWESVEDQSSGEGMVAVGDDGLLVKEIEDTAPNVQLVDNVIVKQTNDEVLAAMSEEYLPNTVFFSKEYGAPEGTESTSESDLASTDIDTTADITDVRTESDGDMVITVDAESDKYLIVNEYADKGWKAYIDGEETTLYEGNGLFRTVAVPAGEHTIELRYESSSLHVFGAIAVVGLAVLLVVGVCARRENAWFDRIGETSDTL